MTINAGFGAAQTNAISSANPVKKIIIHSSSNAGSTLVVDFKDKPFATMSLDLGDDWAGVVELIGPTKDDKLRVQLIYETSMTIQNEGPHLDLTNWKHYKSESVAVWPENEKTPEAHRFVINTDRIKSGTFPFVSKNELVAAVRAEIKKNKHTTSWDQFAEKCIAPQSYPCGVGISKLWIQVFPADQFSGKPLAEAELIPAMGC